MKVMKIQLFVFAYTAHTVDDLYCLKKTHSFNVHTYIFLTYVDCKFSIFILISVKN